MGLTLSVDDMMLHPLSSEHHVDYIRLVNDATIGRRLNHLLPFGMIQFHQLLEKLKESDSSFVWMIEDQNRLCGAINARALHPGLFQGGYWIDPTYCNKGMATKALQRVNRFLFQEMKAVRIQALVEPDNFSSIRVLEKCGYHREALLQKYFYSVNQGLLDVCMYSTIQPNLSIGQAS